MKHFLIAGILFICAISGTIAEQEELVGGPFGKFSIKDFNKGRKQMAERCQIANMYEVKWSDDLAKQIPEIDCSKPKDRKSMKLEEDLKMEKVKTAKDFADTIEKYPDTMMECYNPLMTEVGCQQKKCKSDGRYEMECRCEPKKTFSRSDIKEGKPGSKCDNGVKDGLCIASGSEGLMNILTLGALNLIIFYLVSNMI